jgi:hypothetical protein
MQRSISKKDLSSEIAFLDYVSWTQREAELSATPHLNGVSGSGTQSGSNPLKASLGNLKKEGSGSTGDNTQGTGGSN